MKTPRKKEVVEQVFWGLDIMVRSVAAVGIRTDNTKIFSLWIGKDKGLLREYFYYEHLIQLLKEYPNSVFGMEDYAYGKGGQNSRSVFTLGEITGIFKLNLYQRHYPTYVFGIGQIKKFFTGYGNAQKIDMISAASGMTSHITIPIKKNALEEMSHLSDAFAIANMTRFYSSGIVTGLSELQRRWLETHNAGEFIIQ